MQEMRLAVLAPSLGGVETLMTLPATTSHLGMSPEERRKIGIADGLVRVSVGIEDVMDLKADFTQALDKAA
jgi:cystathionine beta-lyase/cystathionine gamma-synthase